MSKVTSLSNNKAISVLVFKCVRQKYSIKFVLSKDDYSFDPNMCYSYSGNNSYVLTDIRKTILSQDCLYKGSMNKDVFIRSELLQ